MNEIQTKTGEGTSEEKKAIKKEAIASTDREHQTAGGSREGKSIEDEFARHGQPSPALNLVWEKAQRRKRLLTGEAAAAHPANSQES